MFPLSIICFSFFVFFVFFDADSVIRIHDSTTPRYKRINEITAKDVNWCILDIASSADGESFVYSTWSSCRKFKFKNSSIIRSTSIFFLNQINFSSFKSYQWYITSITAIISTSFEIKFLCFFVGILELWWRSNWWW